MTLMDTNAASPKIGLINVLIVKAVESVKHNVHNLRCHAIHKAGVVRERLASDVRQCCFC
jgi:hypothetical protein